MTRFAILALLASPAMAANNCAPRDLVAANLASRHQEHVIGRGTRAFVHGVGVVEIWASESGSWTETVTYDNGMTCLTASGQNWTAVAAPNVEAPGELN